MVITRVLFKRPLPASHITGDLTCRISDMDLKGRLRVVQGLIRTLRKENIDVPDVKNGNWRLIFSLFQCSNLCADVPPPSEKKSGEETKKRDSSPDFLFLRDREGGCLYTGYQCSHSTNTYSRS